MRRLLANRLVCLTTILVVAMVLLFALGRVLL